jgi:hypothetical protein
MKSSSQICAGIFFTVLYSLPPEGIENALQGFASKRNLQPMAGTEKPRSTFLHVHSSFHSTFFLPVSGYPRPSDYAAIRALQCWNKTKRRCNLLQAETGVCFAMWKRIEDSEFAIRDARFTMQDAGCKVQDTGCRCQRCKMQEVERFKM